VAEAERQVALVWSAATTARSRLRRAITDPGDVFNDLGRDYRPRTDAIWATLEQLLGPGNGKQAA
jgi:hypothetical protein